MSSTLLTLLSTASDMEFHYMELTKYPNKRQGKLCKMHVAN